MVIVLVALMGMFVAACEKLGDTTNNIYPSVIAGNTAVQETGVSFMFRAVNSYGKDADLSITKVENGMLYSMSSESITITQDKIFRPLEQGEYYAGLSSPLGEFTGEAHFFVQKGEVSGIYIDITEYTMVKVYTTTMSNSPWGNGAIGDNVPIFDFGVNQDYSGSLALSILGFRVHASSGVQIAKAHLYYLTLAGWNEIAVPCSNYCDASGCDNYFELTLDPLTPIGANCISQYQLTLDITAANPGDTLYAEIVYIGDWSPTDPNVRFSPQSWAMGNTLSF